MGILLAVGGYTKIWPLFGAANQLLAGLSLLAVCVWLGKIGKKNGMFYIPMAFMTIATVTSLVITFKNKLAELLGGQSADALGATLQVVFAAILIVLAVVLVIEGLRTLAKIKKEKSAAA